MMEVPYHYQFRIIVIGDTMVGKSSLLKTFAEGTFGGMEPTVGVDFFSKIIDIRPKLNLLKTEQLNDSINNNRSQARMSNLHNENIIVKLQIWDTAGQERFKSIVTSYYRNSVGIILVYDVTNRESYDNLLNWFLEAQRYVEPDSPSSNMTTNYQSPSSSSFPLTSTPNNASNYPLKNSNDKSSNIGTSNCSSNSNNLYSMLKHHRNSNIAYIVVGCKTDLEDQRQVDYEDGKAFADTYGFKFIETSSRAHQNVNQAFEMLAEEIYDKISESGRLNRLHRTPSGTHLTLDRLPPHVNEGIRIGPLIGNHNKRFSDNNRTPLLEAQPVAGFLGGCC